MSARSIGYPDWIRALHHGLAQDHEIAERLILEIIESSAMGMAQTMNPFMRDLQAHEISFAMDDFAGGYTSCGYLRDFSFDLIKIDCQSIRNIAARRDNRALTQALLSIAQHFEMFTVAEQVETAGDAAFLIEHGIGCLQGFYFGASTISPLWRAPNAAARR